MTPAHVPRRPPRSEFIPVRGLRCHVNAWGMPSPGQPPLVLTHGWMDVGASYQFVVDALARERWVVAPDWRGFGRSESPAADSYWFPDYLGDLDALLQALSPDQPVDLVGHSMGGNVVMMYAGVRPERVRRLVNLEGFGLPESRPHHAPKRYRQWLDELRTPMQLRPYDSLDAVAERLVKNNPRLTPDRASWLAAHWAERRDDGQWHILGDPAHKRVNPQLYRKDEVLECWKRITAPVLWVEGDLTDAAKWWGDRYPRAEFDERLAMVPNVQRETLSPCGHMLHLDQPEALATLMERFLGD
jgi:pimeloyl-ACP methyl ester carboxylesterase